MRYSDLIQLYFERSNALQWYWTVSYTHLLQRGGALIGRVVNGPQVFVGEHAK